MEHNFISYKQTMQLYYLHFVPNEVLGYYTIGHPTLVDGVFMKEIISHSYSLTQKELDSCYIPAPIYKDVFKWFKETHNLSHTVTDNESTTLDNFILNISNKMELI